MRRKDDSKALAGTALIKETCRRIRVARAYWDAHNNRACRGEREKGPMTASDLNRKAHINDTKLRDVLVERFAQEDLVRIDGKTIRPTGFEEFVKALYARKEFPVPVSQWASLPKAKPPAD